MRSPFLLGLDVFSAEAQETRAAEARERIKKAEPAQKATQARATTEKVKLEAKKSKVDSTIRTYRQVEAQRKNGSADMLLAAEQEVTIRATQLLAALISLEAADEDLSVEIATLEVWRDNLESASSDLNAALLNWIGTDDSAPAKELELKALDLLVFVKALIRQIANGPEGSGDELAVQLSVLIVWQMRVMESAQAYLAARSLLPVGDSAPAIDLAEAGGVVITMITGTDTQIEEFIRVGKIAQDAWLVAYTVQQEYDGAKDVLDSLTRGIDPGAAMSNAVAERRAQAVTADRVAAELALADQLQAMRRRLTGD